MGCHSTKLQVSAAASPPACEVHELEPPAGTLLVCEHSARVAELPTVRETVVKHSRPEWVMMPRSLETSALENPTSSKGRTSDITDITLTDEAIDAGERSESLLPAGSPEPSGGQFELGADLDFAKPAEPSAARSANKSQRRSRDCLCDCCETDTQKRPRRRRLASSPPGPALESLIVELFRAHDLNSDGLLDEQELIRLNEAVAEVHDVRDLDAAAVREKYSNLFREKLDSEGRPVPYPVFRDYILKLLGELDSHEDAQEMLMEQFLVEARLARTVVTGAPLQTDNSQQKICYPSCIRFCKLAEAATEFKR